MHSFSYAAENIYLRTDAPQKTDITDFEKWSAHCKCYSVMFSKITGGKRNVFINAPLNLKILFVSDVSKEKRLLFRIVGDSEEVFVYFVCKYISLD